MIGERIHCYEISAHLGQGGMGNVFKATDTMLNREVALKVLHPQLTIQPQFLERFKKEARLLAKLLHPNIAVIYNFLEQEGNHFMVMEYVEGTSLDELLKKHKALPTEFVVPAFIQALEGLHHAHRKNILHRDIKPANLMLSDDGVLKLMDFGIAKIAGEQKMTQVNKIVGTIEFMAPELIEGKDATPASDIYSMGATLYELVSGKIPFEGDTDFNIMQAILKAKLKTPEKLNQSVPPALSNIIMKAMDRNPENRYVHAKAFQQALLTAFPKFTEIDLNILKKTEQPPYPATKFAERPQDLLTRMDTAAAVTQVKLARPLANFAFYKQKIRSNSRLLFIIPVLLLLAIFLYSITGNKSEKNETAAVGDIAKDSVKQTVQSIPVDDHPKDNITLPESAPPAPTQDQRITVKDEPEVIENIVPPKEEKLKKTKRSELKNLEKPIEETKVEPEPVVEKKAPEKKEVYISVPVPVRLSLNGTPDLHERKKTEQFVTFSVIDPVYYQGVLIIKKGALAKGSLTIGSRRTDIKIYEVEAANGNVISLASESAHGRREDIENKQPFTALIKQGVTLNF